MPTTEDLSLAINAAALLLAILTYLDGTNRDH